MINKLFKFILKCSLILITYEVKEELSTKFMNLWYDCLYFNYRIWLWCDDERKISICIQNEKEHICAIFQRKRKFYTKMEIDVWRKKWKENATHMERRIREWWINGLCWRMAPRSHISSLHRRWSLLKIQPNPNWQNSPLTWLVTVSTE